MMIKHVACAALFVLVGISAGTFADDTELYVVESSVRTGANPKVLIIFDNSGSMTTIEENAPGAYDSTTTYEPISSAHAYQDDKIYFTKGIGIDNAGMDIPLSPSDSRRFLKDINGCHQSWDLIERYGRFTGFVGEYRIKGKTGSWGELRDNSGANYDTIDCLEDIQENDPINAKDKDGNAHGDGFPIDGMRQGNTPKPYSTTGGDTQLGLGEAVTLYTANYLRWHAAAVADALPTSPQSRLDIAKTAIETVINTNTSVDFGLALFNMNYPSEGNRDGGRIVSKIQKMSPANKTALLSTIDGIPADTNTPLCETLFEAYKYFSGKPVLYGKKDSDYSTWYEGNKPPRDTSAESGLNYSSPFRVCPDIAYVIYITDGVPTQDTFADTDIVTLTASGVTEKADDKVNAPDYSVFSDPGLSSPSYLPALASYLYHNDLVTSPETLSDGSTREHMQTVKTFTIGFSSGAEDAEALLKETAKRGGNKVDDDGVNTGYFQATGGLGLVAAMNDALLSIMETDASFTSPSIASNNFDRTQTFDAAYYAMFLPGRGPRWSGNLKKLKVTSGGVLVDKSGSVAIGDGGDIKDTACTFWSLCTGKSDGKSVLEGGVIEALQRATPSTGVSARTIYSNLTSPMSDLAQVLEPILSTSMGIVEADVSDTVKWLYGYDVDSDNPGGSATDFRSDIMGDPLHSKPLALNFGTKASPDIRIVLGTNQGLVHMFKDTGDEVEESWAFIPTELLSNVPVLKQNVANGGHYIYGMDGSPVSYTETDSSGRVNKAWVFMGMRRGGSSYYALDVTSPDSPSVKWIITPDSSGFSELGQSWSEPIVTTIPGHSGPVLIFGGGYDAPLYDADTVPSTAAAKGKAIYIVDADSGALVHAFTDTGVGGTKMDGLVDSIPNSVAILDSNNDGDTDRIYATDVGGHVWRIDLADSSRSTWSAYKFADLGGSTAINDRRFFAEPAVAQTTFSNISEVEVTDGEGTTTTTTSYQNVPYDAVVIGSGSRPHPTSVVTSDKFFVLQDRNVVTRSVIGEPVPEVLDMSKLYNVTSTPPVTEAENISFGTKRGWYFDFRGSGEKSLTAALIIDGKVFFTSFLPSVNEVSDLVCSSSGQGRLYVFDLHRGTRSYENVYYELGERVPDTPQIVVPAPETGEDPYIYIIGVGKGEIKDGAPTGTINVGAGLGVNKIYYHIDE
ncbi:pilus assembly protein [Shewanella nanhaiensis]|uniref:rRNA (Guanine-N1)-methyltransferase n=1 Tax=Shewanella nanhaiensis TaxID=2864872 RepID=A0ABS7E478_9GAMM|nr:PilC/PilY family type IV pilus protein [Shewanella nanhaiensis]MBW8184440.1 rRNA (guanine-N1)-methyltransferase [Shewanella nanhaiensis]